MRQLKYFLNYLGYLNNDDNGFHITVEQMFWIIFILGFLLLALAPFATHLAGMFNRADAKLDSYTF